MRLNLVPEILVQSSVLETEYRPDRLPRIPFKPDELSIQHLGGYKKADMYLAIYFYEEEDGLWFTDSLSVSCVNVPEAKMLDDMPYVRFPSRIMHKAVESVTRDEIKKGYIENFDRLKNEDYRDN